MKAKILFLLVTCIMLAVATNSCSNDGEIGPAGPAGIDGIDGADGADGADGNANVTSISLPGQTIVTGVNIFTVPELTQDIFDNGVVLGYVTVPGNSFWETLPVTDAGSIILEIDRIRVGEIQLRSTFDQTLDFRFVLIAGTTTGKGKISVKDLQKMSYEEVIDYFGLEY